MYYKEGKKGQVSYKMLHLILLFKYLSNYSIKGIMIGQLQDKMKVYYKYHYYYLG